MAEELRKPIGNKEITQRNSNIKKENPAPIKALLLEKSGIKKNKNSLERKNVPKQTDKYLIRKNCDLSIRKKKKNIKKNKIPLSK